MDKKPCTHTDQIKEEVEAKTPEGCEECLKSGDEWVALRMCMTCGHVGCCDSSKNKHATKHFNETNHPIIQQHGVRDPWKWCYVDETYL